MMDRVFARHNLALAARAKVVPELDARLVRIDPAEDADEYYVLQCLEDPALGEEARFFSYQRSGRTGTPGELKVDGPMQRGEVEAILGKVFQEKTGAEWGSIKPGDRAPPGMYWLQQQAQPDLKAKWEYYVGDGVDGKPRGWYPYEPAASDEVEEIYAQHEANSRESRTATRVVSSGYFKYRVDLAEMAQENTKTRKVREIRRVLGDGPGPQEPPARPAKLKKAMMAARTAPSLKAAKALRAMKAKKAAKPKKAMKAMKKKKKQVSKIAKGKSAKKDIMSGKKEKTGSGLKKDDLTKNKFGKIVSKKMSAIGKRRYQNVEGWNEAFMKARAELGLTGFVPLKKGSELYKRTRELSGRLPDADAAPAALLRKVSTKSLG